MKKKSVLLGTSLLCIFAIIYLVIFLFQNEKFDKWSSGITREADEKILNSDNLIDLGNHIIAYRIPNDKNMSSVYGVDENFGGEHYIVIRSIDTDCSSCDTIYYLPDIYGNILEIKYEETNSLYIKYEIIGSDKVEETRIPVFFTNKLEDGFIDIKQGDIYNRKCILGGQDGLQDGRLIFSQVIWEILFAYKERNYEIIFERVSPIYIFPLEVEGYYADYCLKVSDEQGNIISEQMIINFPVKYEEVYWNIDFSGNGFMDIAFCTDMYNVSKYGWTELATLIWNFESNMYEKKEFPIYRDIEDRWWNMPLWNQEWSSIISFVGRTASGDAVMERYVFSDEIWKCVGRLEPFYAESNISELQYLGYQELNFSTEGELIGKNVITESVAVWLNEESLWSRYNMNNEKLYPNSLEWEEVLITIGKVDIPKYVRSENNPKK